MTVEPHQWHVEQVASFDEFVCVDEQHHHTRRHFFGRESAEAYCAQLNALNLGGLYG